MAEKENIFKNGSQWLRADFHLHTKADKEFKYDGDEKSFVPEYVERLHTENIGIGVITNHNKFDKDEFIAIKKAARSKNIWMVPGIEYSIKEGIHLLIAFEEEWYKGNNDHINEFISKAFYGITNYDTPPYPNSALTLKETVEALDRIGNDYFVALAHPDSDNGLCKVLKGRTLEAFINEDSFKRIIAIQKSGNKENFDRICELAGRQIAYVEGTDNAAGGIGAIGTGRTIFLKIGDFNFEAFKYALIDHENRIRPIEKPDINNAYIKSISFEGGLLDGKTINYSPELNNFIGIRGSGKSSIIEILRYTLAIPLGTQAMDKNYKNELIEFVLKSGAKVKVTVVNQHKKEYRIEKIFGQKEDVYEENIRKDITIDAVFNKPVYFGQKDLSNKDIDFEANLVKQLIGNRLDDIQVQIKLKAEEIRDILGELKKLENLEDVKKETNEMIKNAEHNIKIFKDKGIQDKLKQQNNYDSDIAYINSISKSLSEYSGSLKSLIENYAPFFKNTVFLSEENKELFGKCTEVFTNIKTEFSRLSKIRINTEKQIKDFTVLENKLRNKKESLKEEFAKIKRGIDIPNLNPDDFLKWSRQIQISHLKLKEIEKSEKRRNENLSLLNNKISELNNLWHEEFKIIEKEVKRINENKSSLSIDVKYKGRRDKFLEKIKQTFRGSRITESNYEKIRDIYQDFIEIYRDKDKLGRILSETHLAEFNKRFNENLLELLVYFVEPEYTIKYNEKPLNKYSLGQRATALILFLLAQKETNVLIIDQPEDDLDNQTIYEDVIKEIKSLKGKMQFIFATHNANIPVLGDSEKIISCKYLESKIELMDGTIDNHEIQKEIVRIMEGGEEAFNRRKNIYELWSMKR